MKKMLHFIVTMLLGISVSNGQVILAQWSFPTGTSADSMADGGIPSNLDKAIHTEGGTSEIDFSKNGYTTKAAQADGWDNGADLKCWVIEITTTDYDHLKINSRQQSGGNNAGPRDWKAQYRIGTGGTWTDIPGAILNVQNDWTTGVLDSIGLPDECNNLPSLFIRWIMTSNINSAGGQVTASGIDKIDDIVMTGKLINTALWERDLLLNLSVYPNPCTDRIRIVSPETLISLDITDETGRVVVSEQPAHKEVFLDTGDLPAGCYFIRATTISSRAFISRFIRLD